MAGFTGIGVDPQVSSAVNDTLDPTIVRVTFNEPMAYAAALIAPGSYTLTPDGGSVARTAVSVTAENVVNPTWVDVLFDGQLTGGSLNYNIAVAGTVTDLALNTLDAAADDVDFDGQGQPAVADTLSLNSLASPAEVEDNGGEKLTFLGVFPDADINVFIDTGAEELPCYSGQSGLGNDARRTDPSTLSVVAPPVPPGTYDVIARSGVLEDTLVAGLTVVNRYWRSRSFLLRRSFPPIFATGPRDLSLQDDLT